MLRKIRLILALLCFVLITGLFLDFTGTLHAWFGWLAKVQFLPAMFALNFVIVAILVVLTLVFGRLYCSVICPLGVMQDVISWVNSRRKKMRYRFTYSPAKNKLRYGVLAVFIIALIFGIGSLWALLEPYSAFGRIMQNLFAPIYAWANNLLAFAAERAGSYAFYEKDVWLRSIPTFVIAAVTLVVLFVLAWRNGRTYCNTICPVGTLLGVLSRFSWFKISIDTEKCNHCGLCGMSCKASCIDSPNQQIDYSRCVVCGNCVKNCNRNAISFKHQKRVKTVEDSAASSANMGRRSFLVGAGIATASAVLAQEKKKVDGGLAKIEDKIAPKRETRIVPAGASSIRAFQRHCTGCQLCVSVCPNDVLRPSTDLLTLMQPEMSFERGYCRPECTKCSDVCPAGAIKPISEADKSSTQIGHAVWIRQNCIPIVDGEKCNACARHCPTKAISMVAIDPEKPKLKVPAINTERCIGCGECEHLCPARPFSAIYVEGHESHRII